MMRPLWTRRADTKEGQRIIWSARLLSLLPRNWKLTDAQLIRLAYWGTTGSRP